MIWYVFLSVSGGLYVKSPRGAQARLGDVGIATRNEVNKLRKFYSRTQQRLL